MKPRDLSVGDQRSLSIPELVPTSSVANSSTNTDSPNDRWSPQRSRVSRGCWEPGRRGESANRKTLTEADDRIDALYKSPADAGIPTLDAVRR